MIFQGLSEGELGSVVSTRQRGIAQAVPDMMLELLQNLEILLFAAVVEEGAAELVGVADRLHHCFSAFQIAGHQDRETLPDILLDRLGVRFEQKGFSGSLAV